VILELLRNDRRRWVHRRERLCPIGRRVVQLLGHRGRWTLGPRWHE
jgi:hypothetical protein